MTKQESSSQATSGALGDAAHRVALGTLALTRAGVRHTATLVDGIVGGGMQAAGNLYDAAGDATRMVVRTLGSRAGDALGLRVTRVLNAFQIPTSRDVNELARRVDQLSRMVAEHNARADAARPEASPASRGAPAATRRKSAKKKAAPARKAGTRAATNGTARRKSSKKTS
jgi:hypothetical protein